ncbi:MAG: class I SAM-dependent methyltransferase [Candidatus Shapirobacteria bacterium]
MTCPSCSFTSSKFLFSAPQTHGRHLQSPVTFDIYRCLKCSAVYPNLKNVNLSSYYTNFYFHHPGFIEKLLIRFNHFLLPRKYPFLFGSKPLRVLDIGCGDLAFLKSIPAQHLKTGIDLNPLTFKGIKSIKADFLTHPFTQNFDFIIMNHSLEHFLNPAQALTKAYSLLAPSGRLVINVPNSQSLGFSLTKRYWFHLDAPRHVILPNPLCLSFLASKLSPAPHSISFQNHTHEFPLALFWGLRRASPLLLPLWPLLTLFDNQTLTFSLSRP